MVNCENKVYRPIKENLGEKTMKKYICLAIILILGLLFIKSAIADSPWETINNYLNPENYQSNLDKVKKLEMETGTSFSFMDGDWNTIFTKRWYEYRSFSLNYGYNLDDALIGTVTYNVATLKDTFGVKIPVLDLLRLDLGLYGGWKRLQALSGTVGNNEFDTGLALTFIRHSF